MERMPEGIDGNVRNLIQSIGSKEEPLYVNVISEPYAKVNECFASVEEKIKRDRGSRQLGWQVWEMPDILIEAEFHAVWRSPDGVLVDITPKPEQKILFIPDSSAKYDGAKVNNIRINISGNQLVDDFIRACDAVHRIENPRERACQRETILSREEAAIRSELVDLGSSLLSMIKKNCTRNSLCFCGSSSKYKHCHSYVLERLISKSRMLITTQHDESSEIRTRMTGRSI